MGVLSWSLTENHATKIFSRVGTTMAMVYLIVILALAGRGLGDDSYTPPQAGYSQPTGSYNPPTGGAYQTPSTGYGYDAPTYDAPVSYASDDDGGKFDLSKIGEILPLFLAVFAAIILAQLLSPLIGLIFKPILLLLGGLFGLTAGKVGLLGGVKLGLLNAIMAQFNLQICTTDDPPVALTARSFDEGKENSASGFSLNPDIIDSVARLLQDALENYSA